MLWQQLSDVLARVEFMLENRNPVLTRRKPSRENIQVFISSHFCYATKLAKAMKYHHYIPNALLGPSEGKGGSQPDASVGPRFPVVNLLFGTSFRRRQRMSC